jgi:hypothetical protein
VSSWVLFFLAIISCGIALIVFYNSVLFAVDCGLKPCTGSFGETWNYWIRFFIGNFVMTFAGAFFGLGLLSLIASSLMSIFSPSSQSLSREGASMDPLIERVVLDASSDTKTELGQERFSSDT